MEATYADAHIWWRPSRTFWRQCLRVRGCVGAKPLLGFQGGTGTDLARLRCAWRQHTFARGEAAGATVCGTAAIVAGGAVRRSRSGEAASVRSDVLIGEVTIAAGGEAIGAGPDVLGGAAATALGHPPAPSCRGGVGAGSDREFIGPRRRADEPGVWVTEGRPHT
jgi:hypothetical protein